MPPRTDDHSDSDGFQAARVAAGSARAGAVETAVQPAGRARRIETPAGLLARVLALLDRAEDSNLPTERRLRLLSLSSRCLDTVFEAAEPVGSARHEALEGSNPAVRELVERQESLLIERLLPDLARRGVELCRWDDLPRSERRRLGRTFDDRIFPVLTPLRVGPAHPSPRLASLVLQVGVLASDGIDGEQFFARLELPAFLPRFVEVPDGRGRRVALEDLVSARVDRLFPGATIESAGAFRVTRSYRSGDPMMGVGASGPLPPRGAAVRLECDRLLAPSAQRLILHALGLGADELYLRRPPIDLGALDGLPMPPS